jgi:hypothetical protein
MDFNTLVITRKVFSSQADFQILAELVAISSQSSSTAISIDSISYFFTKVKMGIASGYGLAGSGSIPSSAILFHLALGQTQQKTPFPNNSSIVIEVCLCHHCIETAVLLLLYACSFLREPVYQAIAQH